MPIPSPAPIYQEHYLQEKHYRRRGHLPWFFLVAILMAMLVFSVFVGIAAFYIPRRRSAPVPAAAADPQPIMPQEELAESYPPSPSSEAGALNEVEMIDITG